MSLLAWYPLTHDCKNYGALGSILDPQLSPTHIFTDGKIGQALSRGTLTLTAEQMKAWIGNTVSIAMWIKVTTHGTFVNGVPFFCANSNGQGQTMTAPNNRKFSLYCYDGTDAISAKTTLHISWQADNNNSTYCGAVIPNFFELDRWIHLCIVQDPRANNVKVYKNGTVAWTSPAITGGLANLPIQSSTAMNLINLTDQVSYINLNDVRIYDHALSLVEIQELAKGLICHYSFDDSGTESGTNLVTRVEPGGQTTYTNEILTTTGANSDTYFHLHLSSAMISGKTYTLSCMAQGIPDGKTLAFGVGSQSTSANAFIIKNGFNSFTFVANSDCSGKTNVLFDDLNTSDNDRTGTIASLSQFMLVEKDHSVGYTKSSRTRTIYRDESGNGHDLTETNITYSTDTPRGSVSATFDGDTSYYQMPWIKSNLFSSDYTINFWVKHADGDTRAVYIGDHNLYSTTSLNFERTAKNQLRYYYNSAKPDYTAVNAIVPNNEWTMVTLTCDQATSTIKFYVNGTYIKDNDYKFANGLFTMDFSKPNTTPYYYIGRDERINNSSAQTPFNGKMSDFRIYATTLSDNDIALLYNNPCSLDDHENIFTGEFLEGEDEINITKNYTVTCDEAYEFHNEEYEQLEYIENSASDKQYINTGWYWHSETARIIADINVLTNSSAQSLFGNEEPTSDGKRYFGMIPYGSNGSYGFYVGSGLPLIQQTGITTMGSRFTLDCSTNENKEFSIYINGGKLTSATYDGSIQTHRYTTSADASKGLIYIFANHNSGQSGAAAIQHVEAMRVYSFKMYDNNILCRNYIPARRKSDGVNGLYDIVNKQFYANAGGSANFKAGPVVTTTDVAFFKDGHISGYSINEI